MSKVDIKNIIAVIRNNRKDELKNSELRFRRILPLLPGSKWKAVDEHTVCCPVCDCPSEIVSILTTGPGRYDDGRCDVSLRGDIVVLNYDNWHEMLSFFQDTWGMDIYV